ncbi:MAG: hypothetical protein C6I00_03370 [Nitratiruptor sp.]|nr:hypothetical protein [Nitratiruptor sp.]NPA83139.1 hypothetical protein [Campylobacterota bacterium]
MFDGVSLDQAPPFEAPLLFFLTAPLFAIVGSILLEYGAGEFAILHAFSIGFLAFIMVGALLQMLPVVVGVKFERPKRVALLFWLPLVGGTLALIATLGFGQLSLALFAAATLLLALGGFALVTLVKLFKAPRKSDAVIAMILALLSLLLATLLGGHLLAALARGKELSLLPLHGALAGFGWVGLLIVGVSYQVIPMFYITQELPAIVRRPLAPAIFAALLSYALFQEEWLFKVVDGLFLLFALATFWRLFQRKRTVKEPTVAFFQVAMIFLAATALYGLFHGHDWRYLVAFGYGFAMSVVYGMLYKIIPFLVWFHLSSRGFFDIPTMRELISERLAWLHLYIHLASLSLLLTTTKSAAPLILAENLLFLWIIKAPILLYFRYKKRPSPFATST